MLDSACLNHHLMCSLLSAMTTHQVCVSMPTRSRGLALRSQRSGSSGDVLINTMTVGDCEVNFAH